MTSNNQQISPPVARDTKRRAKAGAVEREAILVLGMHRSGTSALTRVISLLGADLPSHLMAPKQGNNETGFWESQEAYRLNDAILESAGSGWDDWCRFNPQWFDSPKATAFRKRAMDLLEIEFENSPLFVFKDPRVCRLLPFWLDVLHACGSRVKFVFALRNPLEIAASLKKRDGFAPAKSHILWLRHQLEAERDTRGSARAFISYDELLEDWRSVVSHLGESLEMAWPRWSATAEVEIDEFLSDSHRHHLIDNASLGTHPEIGDWVKDAAEAFGELLLDSHSSKALHSLDKIHAEFDRASDALGTVLRAEEIARKRVEKTAADRADEVAETTAALADRDNQIGERNRQIHDLQERIAAYTAESDRLVESLTERDVQIQSLHKVVEDVQSESAASSLTLAERDQRITELEEAIRAREAATRELEAVIGERDSLIQVLQEKATEHAVHNSGLKEALAQQEAAVKDLKGNASAREGRIVELERTSSELDAELAKQKKNNVNVLEQRNQALYRLDTIQSGPAWRLTRSLSNVRRRLPRFLRSNVALPPRRCCGVMLSRRERYRVRRQAQQLLDSNLFDVSWYIEQNPDVVLSAANPILHWLIVGWREGRNPNLMFDTKWYLAKNPDVAESGINPLVHYIKFGANEGRDPGPWFNGDWYLEQNPDVADAGLNPLRHYLRFGRDEGRRSRRPDSVPDSTASTQTVVYSQGNNKKAAVSVAGLSTAGHQVHDAHAADNALFQRIYRYRDIKAKRGKAKVVVYTANIGNYDTLIQHQNICDDWDYVCISDRPIPGLYCWDFRYADYINADPVRTARYFKTHPHLLFPEYEYSIWIDGNIDIVGDHLKHVVERLMREGGKIASVTHPHWNCIYADAEKCIEFRKDDADTIREQVGFLKEHQYPSDGGLIETNVMFRSHSDAGVIDAMNQWWSVICRFSRRDQLSFNFVLHQHGLICDSLFENPSDSTRNHPDYRYYLHPGESSHAYSFYSVPFFNRDLPLLSGDPFEYGHKYSFDHDTRHLDPLAVDIIVPVYNSLSDVQRCLDSVTRTIDERCRIIIADDGSDSEVKVWLRTFAESTANTQLLDRKRNIGFTRNINGAIRESRADFVILLNSDTLVSRGWVERLLLCAYSADDIGLVGPLSNAASWQSIPDIEDGDGKLAVNALPPGMTVEDVNTYLQEISLHPFYPRVHLLNGFCLGVKRKVFDSVGLFDEKSFPRGYGEEDDFCLRAHEAGHTLAVATHTYVYHAKSKSFGAERRTEIASQSWEKLQSRYGSRYLKNAIDSSKGHPGLTNIRALFQANRSEQVELAPAQMRLDEDRGWSAIEVPNLVASYDAPETTQYYETSRPYRGHTDVSLIAFYLPQFYPFPKNDEVWGKGFTEWTNVTRALPLFKGHDQPKLPDAMGFYDTRLKETLVSQVELAIKHGIKGFCFHHYFFKDEPVMRVPLDLFLANPDIDFPFCLHWANEPWTTTWTYTYRDSSADAVIYDQEHTEANDLAFIEDARRALADPRYIRIDGRPLLMIYRPGLFPDIKATIARWRRYCLDNGVGDLHMVMVQTNAEGEQDPRKLGFDAAVEFPPHLIQPKYLHQQMQFFYPEFDGAVIDYQAVVRASLNKAKPDYLQYRGLFPRWDNTPRKIRGTSIFVNDSPESYRLWLEGLITLSRDNLSKQQRLIFVNAWNEWAEGAFLEPDRKYGYAYLNAGARALESTAPARADGRILAPEDRIAIQIHAFHVEVFERMFQVLQQGFSYPADLLISTCSDEDRARIGSLASHYRSGKVIVRVFENRGRDIAPFVAGFGDLLPRYTYAIHLHTKKSDHGSDYVGWLDYLLGELVGDPDKVNEIFRQISQPDVGIVFPRHYWRVKERIRWGANLERTNKILDGTGIVLSERDQPFFPSGSMFYFRPDALRGLFAKGFSFDDFTNEAGQIDGTLAHAIERSFCYFAQSAGYRSIMR